MLLERNDIRTYLNELVFLYVHDLNRIPSGRQRFKNGLGDRLQETVDGQTITFAMDFNTGLPQVLSDSTNTYT